MNLIEQEHHSRIAVQELLLFKGKTKSKEDYQQWCNKYHFLYRIVPDPFFGPKSTQHPCCDRFSEFYIDIYSFLKKFDKVNSIVKIALSEFSEDFITDDKALIHWLIKFKPVEKELFYSSIYDEDIDEQTNFSFYLENQTDFTDMIRFQQLYDYHIEKIGRKYKSCIKVTGIFLWESFDEVISISDLNLKEHEVEQYKEELNKEYERAFLQPFYIKLNLDLDRVLEVYFS